jgi:DNA adenine methylase
VYNPVPPISRAGSSATIISTANEVLLAPESEGYEEQRVKPPLKWAGGKRWLVPHLRKIWKDHRNRRLVEPFCGGLAAALGVCPERAFLNDVNPHPINFYKWLKRGLTITLQMRNDETLYYRYRERFNKLIAAKEQNSSEAAALFYYLNRTGYNGLCRFNSEGFFNVPFGRYKQINYQTDFAAYRRAFAAWSFTSTDFENVALSREDFVYADPPYDVQFTKYAKEDFRWEDQERLAHWLARHKGPVVLSNQATDRVLILYRRLGFDTEIVKAPRMISCTGDRTPASEVLAFRGF